MKTMTSAIAAALIASASFAGAALANEGDYYVGASDASATVDNVQTGSIAKDAKEIPAPLNRGDYYNGAERPN